MFYRFLVLWQGLSTCLSFRFLWFSLCGPPRRQNPQDGRFSEVFNYHKVWSSCRDQVNILCLKILEEFYKSHSLGRILVWAYLVVWSNFNFLHNSQWIPFSTLSFLILYSFCVNLLHSLTMWLIVSSLLLYSLYLLFCYNLLILDLIHLILMTLFCAAIGRESVSLLKFPWLCPGFLAWDLATLFIYTVVFLPISVS